MTEEKHIGAIVLAGGMSTRMGQMKVLLPWVEDRPIIAHIVRQLQLAHIKHITVVTGHKADEVAIALKATNAQVVHNPAYASGEMLSSLQTGLRALPENMAAALVVLGDQPRIQTETVTAVADAYKRGAGSIVAPSYNMRRGHPILIDRRHWQDMLNLPANGAPRDVINANAQHIAYVIVDNDSVLKDVDTPQAYQEERRRAGLD